MKKSGRVFCFLTLFLLAIFPIQNAVADEGGSLYHLPYPDGVRIFNQQSPFSKIKDDNHTYFAFDFKAEYPEFDRYEPAPVVAAKGGWVVYRKDCDDGFKEEEANLVVLGHYPKGDGTYREYSFYVHLKQGSIPEYVIVGGYIRAGVKIGLEGHNGLSTGIHLHFCVTDWFDLYFMYQVGTPGVAAKTYQLDAQKNRVYKTIPFRFIEYEDVLSWEKGNCLWSENAIIEVLTDPNEPQP